MKSVQLPVMNKVMRRSPEVALSLSTVGYTLASMSIDLSGYVTDLCKNFSGTWS